MRNTFITSVFMIYATCLMGQVAIDNTNFSDANFRTEVLKLDTSTPKDNSLSAGEIAKITSLGVSRKSISNLKGIEHFTALTYLNCSFNELTSLDVSKNTALTYLYYYENSLTSLDLSKNTALTNLSCYNNSLTSLDVSNNTALTNLNCRSNKLTSLDVSKSTVLSVLSCYDNQLTSLDLSKNTALTYLGCNENVALTSLDLSKNTALTSLYCNENLALTSLNIKNGNNNILKTFNASSNPNLTCILIDDGFTIPSTGWTKDATASYSTACVKLDIADNKTLPEVSIYKVNDAQLRIAGLPAGDASIKIYSILGKEIISNSFSTISIKDIFLPPLSSGIYIIQVETETGKLTRKISF